MDRLTLEQSIARVELIKLKARFNETQNYPMNTDMHIERTLLNAEIEALERFVKTGKTNGKA